MMARWARTTCSTYAHEGFGRPPARRTGLRHGYQHGRPASGSRPPRRRTCTPNGGIDPALCRELAKLDRKNATPEKPVSDTASKPDEVSLDRSGLATFGFYIHIGFQHILPGGMDHILFVLALFLSSLRIKSLLLQISAFTIAHTATLGLAA